MNKAYWNKKIVDIFFHIIGLAWLGISIAIALGFMGGIYAQIALWLSALSLLGTTFNIWKQGVKRFSTVLGLIGLWLIAESFWPFFPVTAQWVNVSIAIIFLCVVIMARKRSQS